MKITYRPEIDGLRAIAVFSVIIYHFKFSLLGDDIFKGGFIGVDIFYVISGYLISFLILKELEISKDFSFINFYERRARRILPVLLVVVLATLPFAWTYLLPNSLINYAQSVLFTLIFSSNIYFWHIGEIYGAESSALLPLLHTWSLSVEEQFYLIFPIILYFFFKFLRKYLIHIIIIGIISSLIIADFGSRNYPSFNFFILPTRGWELLAGGILAQLELKYGRSNYNIFNQLFPTIGLLLIFYSFIFFDDEMRHPSLFTIAPVVGVMAIIWFANKKDFVTKVLSSKIFVGCGLISYSLYLWHYPIFSFAARIFDSSINNIEKIGLVILTTILSILTFYSVEKPFRKKKSIKIKNFIFFITFLTLVLAISSSFILKNNGSKSRLNLSKFQKDFIFNDNDKLEKSFKNLEFKENSKKEKLLIVGNSHGFDLYHILSANEFFLNKYDIGFLHIQINCLKNAIINNHNDCLRTLDYKMRSLFESQFRNYSHADTLLIRTRWSENAIKSLPEIIKLVKPKKIIIISAAPEFNFKKRPQFSSKEKYNQLIVNQLYKNSSLIDQFVLNKERLPNLDEKEILEKEYYKIKEMRTKKTNQKLKKISKDLNVKYLDFNDIACDINNEKCEILTKSNSKIYVDANGHLSFDGARYFSNKMKQKNWLQLN